MAESKGEIFRIYKRLKFKKSILGILKIVFSMKCDICLTNLHSESTNFTICQLTKLKKYDIIKVRGVLRKYEEKLENLLFFI